MQINDYVVYRLEGICKVTDVVHPDFASDKDRQYFVLVPIEKTSSKTYIPVDTAEQRCRKLISKDDALKLVSDISNIPAAEIRSDKDREQIYHDVLASGDFSQLISVMKNVLERNRRRERIGKRITSADEKFYRQAEQVLSQELGFVLEMSAAAVKKLVQ